MFYWIYDIPAVAVIAMFIAVSVGICWLGILAFRPLLGAVIPADAGLNEILGDFLQYFGVIYGLLLGLLAVATYQNHTDVDKVVTDEASSLAALYRDVSSYPEPDRGTLQGLLAGYRRYVIEEAWPLQRQGVVPAGGVERLSAFQARLSAFEPQTKGQEILHATAFRQFNSYVELRRGRLFNVNTGIPPILWYTVALGAAINLILLWLFELPLFTHLTLGGLISVFTAAMISLTALMDHPMRGDVGISPEAFVLVYDQLMRAPAEPH